jgi:hypothetical protein
MRSVKRQFPPSQLHGVATVAAILDCSRQHVRDLIRQNKLKAIQTSEGVNLIAHAEAIRLKEQWEADAAVV